MIERFTLTRRLAACGCAVLLGLAAGAADARDAQPVQPQTVVVPAGTFEMGKMVNHGYGDIDGPTHTVEIKRPFALAKHEVTLSAFRAFVRDTGHVSRGKCNIYEEGTSWFIHPERNWERPGFPQEENHPVVCVTWRDAQAYIAWLNRKTGREYRLPSEAEYEYVASRGGVGRKGGVVTHDVANIGKVECCGGEVGGKDVWRYTAPVGSFPPDKFGLHDVRGNVWEWQDDCYHATYNGAPADGAARQSCPEPGYRVVRGGSYGDAGEFLSERFRLRGPEDQGYFTVGFRVAEAPPQDDAALMRPVAAMFEATRQRDLDGLLAPLSRETEPEIVYYWGETVRGRDAIREWHREWFEEEGWRLEPERLGLAFADERVAALNYTVEYVKTPQRRFHILIACTLLREQDGWKIARMQQTLLEGPTE